ncbi:MAG: NUDIX domain-containing protein [Clostridiaceae bacterium]|nr:NUDIX domain-containing protein [Clostridiaceae bacterium]
MKDILFHTESFVFSYRVAGVIIQNGCLLLQKPLSDIGYSFIGGHVALGETSSEALKREFYEETGAKIGVKELMAIGEVFFPWGKLPCHQISLYYRIEPDGCSLPLSGSFKGFCPENNSPEDISFCWVPIESLPKIVVYPSELIPHILSGSRDVRHFISHQE